MDLGHEQALLAATAVTLFVTTAHAATRDMRAAANNAFRALFTEPSEAGMRTCIAPDII